MATISEYDEDVWLRAADRDVGVWVAARLDVEGMLNRIKHRAAQAEGAGLGSTVDEYERELTVVGAQFSRALSAPVVPADLAGHNPATLRPADGVRTVRPVSDLDGDLAAAINGNPGAVARLLAMIRPLVVRYCRARIGTQDQSFASADQVAQEVCLAVLTSLPGYRDRSFLGFVYRIAAHTVADAHRAAAENRAESVAVPDTQAELDRSAPPAVSTESSTQVERLLSVLPARQREVLLLRVAVGLSAEETAMALGSTTAAVRAAQHNALALLRAEAVRFDSA